MLPEQPSPEKIASSWPLPNETANMPARQNAMAHSDLDGYRLLVDHAMDMLCRLTREGIFHFVSPASVHLFGYEPSELIGHSKLELVHPEDQGFIHCFPAQDLDDPQASNSGPDFHSSEYRMRRKDGSYIWVQTRSQIIRDEQGHHRETILTVRDMTQYKQTQDNLRHSERLASLGTLAAGIAHEINNPLGAILMAAHAAREFNRQQGQQDKVEQMLDQIMTDTRRGSQIVRSVLQFARQEPPKLQTIRLRELALSARLLAMRYADKRNIDIKVRGPDDSPWVHVGALSIEQALVNLLHNAMDAGAKRIEVQVRPMPDIQRVSVQVIDDGAGMTPQQVAKAFDPFYTGRPNSGGTGLGLSIAQGIIVAYGGKISLNSVENQGTTVTFDLPMTSAPTETTKGEAHA